MSRAPITAARFDRFVDEVAQSLTTASAPALRARVAARLDVPARRPVFRLWMFAAAGAGAAALTLFVLGDRMLHPRWPAAPAPSAAVATTRARPVSRLPPAPSPARAASPAPASTSPPARDSSAADLAWRAAAVPALEAPPPLRVDAIQPPPLTIAQLDVSPIATDPLTVPPIDRRF